MKWRLFYPGPLFSGHKKAPSWALMAGAVPAPAGPGRFDPLLDGVLEYLVLFRDVLAVVNFFEWYAAVVEDVALDGITAALIDGGTLAVGFIVEVEPGRFGQKKIPMGVHQMMTVVLV